MCAKHSCTCFLWLEICKIYTGKHLLKQLPS